MIMLEEKKPCMIDNSSDSDIDYEYLDKRVRNNKAVRESRMKLKKKMKASSKRINCLRIQKEELQNKLDSLKTRCSNIKQLILSLKNNKNPLPKEKIDLIKEKMKKELI